MTVVIAASAGSYTVRLNNFTPSARAGTDAGAWTEVMVEEGAGSGGPWTELGTTDLIPVDPDPEDPATWDILVTGAELLTGWYRVTFLDDDGNQQPVKPVYNGPQIRPTVRDIGLLLHARTTTDGGAEAGTFNDDTDPTGEQVDSLIDVALDQIAIQLPDTLTDKQVAFARRLVSLMAAILVENSHFSDQVQSGDSLAATYQAWLDSGLLKLSESVDGELLGGPSAFSITTETDTQDAVALLDQAGRCSSTCWDWTDL